MMEKASKATNPESTKTAGLKGTGKRATALPLEITRS
jgi:hypothetical protein